MRFKGYLRKQLEGFKDVNAKINALVDSQIGTVENLSRTDENLRNLIAGVDRLFSEGRNGRRRVNHSFPHAPNNAIRQALAQTRTG
jgi:ABC-type transporter Mla subunit MlaD